jgi:diguanylate cyclase (GGDEF)-like protein
VEIAGLSKLAELLQISGSIEEACRVATGALSDLFPQGAGAICLISSSRNMVEVKAHWGAAYENAEVFGPDECWALRRGKAHLTSNSKAVDRCPHASDLLLASHLCIPMIAQGDAIGVFSFSDGNAVLSDPQQRLVVAISEQVTLALANLRLRETLRQQSIRDPLTGLYNRRYLEDSAEREFRRSERHQKPVSVLMLDVDHFKRFNDTFGHDAGDAMLREVGQVIKSNIRREDIACRFGGEELAIIMPDSPLDRAVERATAIANQIRHLDLAVQGQTVGRVTLSIGIAAFPNPGGDWKSVLHAADRALYRAKREGRDRIVLANADDVALQEFADVQRPK